jgi:GNAT superfamily N-acetyltransferase
MSTNTVVTGNVFVDQESRGRGIGRLLLQAALAFLRVVLTTAEGNAVAERLFAQAGFRRTMIEMTCELKL